MSFKPKTIALSVVALLAAAGGIYAFAPGDKESATDNGQIVGSTHTTAKPQGSGAQVVANGQSDEKASIQGKEAIAAKQSGPPSDAPAQAPKKLTRQQLTPPPATEDEKLQKAAEMESNF